MLPVWSAEAEGEIRIWADCLKNDIRPPKNIGAGPDGTQPDPEGKRRRMKNPTRLALVGCLILLLGGAAPWYLRFFPQSRTVYVKPLFMGGLRLFSHQWDVPRSPYWRIETDDLDDPRRSSLVLLEDGKKLDPAHSLHVDVARKGRGRYSHWKGKLIFSASDNTDPRFNKRRYVVRVKLLPKAWVLKAGAVSFGIALCGGAIIIWTRRTRSRSEI